MKKQTNYQERIITRADILVGKPVIKGTRVPVELVLKRLAEDLDIDQLLIAYPRLTRADIQACLAYAQAMVEGEELFPTTKNIA